MISLLPTTLRVDIVLVPSGMALPTTTEVLISWLPPLPRGPMPMMAIVMHSAA